MYSVAIYTPGDLDIEHVLEHKIILYLATILHNYGIKKSEEWFDNIIHELKERDMVYIDDSHSGIYIAIKRAY